MTGYALVRRALPAGDLTITLKSVNHRGLDLHFHLPTQLDAFEAPLRAAVKQRLHRGHIDIRAHWAPAVTAHAVRINEDLLGAYVGAFQRAAAKLGLDSKPDLNTLLRLPGMMEEANGELGADFGDRLLEVFQAALDELEAFRAREGGELLTQILRHNVAIRGAVHQMESLRGEVQPMLENRLRQRLTELLDTAAIDTTRLIQEASLLAERGNIAEELARLRIHSHQLEDLMQNANEIGKRLDFLLQEMNREANTILSKTSGIGDLGLKLTDLALSAKSDIEKIREQSLNLE
ncbi:MAG: YicC family protein [Bryobacteraceae bacterium]|nr:YicC family protein [Bryobacteraceae bacterium]